VFSRKSNLFLFSCFDFISHSLYSEAVDSQSLLMMRQEGGSMKQGIMTVAILTGCFSMSLAVAKDKVVVIPLMDNCSQPRVEVPVVTSAGRTWMALNLGASQVATSSADPASYGTLYQWGRPGDGHEYRSSPTATQLSNTDAPGHGRFILPPYEYFDWRNPKNDNLWQGVGGINNPCPAGFRLPTAAEWETEKASWSSQNAAGAFASPLKLVLAGSRQFVPSDPGTVFSAGSMGLYWSSTVHYSGSRALQLDSMYASVDYFFWRAHGFSVRCIKD
jgi:uncharacterized protein (TIGR02145 family)